MLAIVLATVTEVSSTVPNVCVVHIPDSVSGCSSNSFDGVNDSRMCQGDGFRSGGDTVETITDTRAAVSHFA